MSYLPMSALDALVLENADNTHPRHRIHDEDYKGVRTHAQGLFKTQHPGPKKGTPAPQSKPRTEGQVSARNRRGGQVNVKRNGSTKFFAGSV